MADMVWTRRMTRCRFAVFASTVVLATSGFTSPAAAIAAGDEPACAWPQEVSAGTRNIGLPETNATYRIMPFQVRADREITVDGTFPDARYAAFTVYDGIRGAFVRNGVPSHLADHRIVPDPGSRNPWQRPAAPGGHYRLHLRMDVAPGQPNTLPLAPAVTGASQQGYLWYRVYVPAGGTSTPVPLPTLTVTDAGVSRTLPPCDVTTPPAAPTAAPAVVPAETLGFARVPAQSALFPNPDTGYLSVWVTPPGPDDVVVIRGRAPRNAPGAHPRPWPGPRADVRYWSLCTNLQNPNYPVVMNDLPDGSIDPGCRYDDITTLDADRRYTFVLATEAQRARVEAIPGTTFVPFSLTQPAAPHLVLLRNMMSADDFAQSVMRVPADGLPSSAESVMGAYYPRGAACALAVLADDGPAGCGLS
jgi:hypothetical protein